MRLKIIFALFLGVSALVCGCSSSGVYRKIDGWLVCDNARPQYHAYYDLFYVAPQAYDGQGEYPYAACDQVLEETTRMFGSHVRVFAPIYHDRQDVERALRHYLNTFHGSGFGSDDEHRPFAIVAEGEGAAILSEILDRQEKHLRKEGLVGCWCSPDTSSGFVTEELVADIGANVRNVLYRRAWDRNGK